MGAMNFRWIRNPTNIAAPFCPGNNGNQSMVSRFTHSQEEVKSLIPEPNSNPRDDDKECQDALEVEFSALIERAIAAGWKRQQVIKALSDLARGLWFDEQRVSPEAEHLPAVGTFPVE